MDIKQSYVVTILTQLAITILLTSCFAITALTMLNGTTTYATTGDPLVYTNFDTSTVVIIQIIIAFAVSTFPFFGNKNGFTHKELIPYEIPYFFSTLAIFMLPMLAEFASAYIAYGIDLIPAIFLSMLKLAIAIGALWGVIIPIANHIILFFDNKKKSKTDA